MEEVFNLESIDRTFTRFKVGEKVNATVVDFMKDGLLLNIGGKKDGFIPFGAEEDEAIKDVKKGDIFEAIITDTHSESGMIILSKKKADDINLGNAIVGGLNVGDNVSIIITGCNKNGLISSLGNFNVFVPFRQISARRIDKNLENYVNKQFSAVVLEIDLLKRDIVASIKAFEENEKITKENAFFESTFINKIVNGKVVRFTDFGAFVNVDGVDCLLPNSEASYERGKKASEVLQLDTSYDFKVIGFNREDKKVSLSYKVLQENPMSEKIKTLKVGEVVNATVSKILPFGAVCTFGDGIDGLLHIKEASNYYIKNIYEVAKVGQKLDLKIIDIDAEKCKVSLSLRALEKDKEVEKLEEGQK